MRILLVATATAAVAAAPARAQASGFTLLPDDRAAAL
jgi:hypothetical protein